jgi:hypothetical protein
MSEYTVTSRILSSEEKIILFGKKVAQTHTAVKATDLDNYLGLFRAMYEGQPINIPGLEELKGLHRVYIYCDLPVGSRYYNESLNKYNGEPRTEVYGVPIQYTKTEINDFLIPLLKEAAHPFEGITSESYKNASSVYESVHSGYNILMETILGGCFINTFNGKPISIATFPAIHSLYNSMNWSQLGGTSADLSLEKDAQASWYYTQFLVPSEIGKDLVDYSPDSKFLKMTQPFLMGQKNEFADTFQSLFNWNAGSGSQGMVIAPGYLKMNGYYKFNDKQYMGISWSGNSPMTESFGFSPAGLLTSNFEQYLFNTDKDASKLSGMYSFTDINSRYRSAGSNRGSFLIVNKDAISTSPIRVHSAVPELIELDKDFFDNISQIVKDERASGNLLGSSDAIEKFRKREFAIKREGYLSVSEAQNSRYITIQNSDSKFFVLTKTSKAKEAARKMAITRKITAAVAPVVDMAVRIFSACDFETGYLDQDFKFPISSKSTFDANYSQIMTTTLMSALDSRINIAVKSYTTENIKNAAEVIKKIYETINYDGNPFFDWHPAETQTRTYRNQFLQLNAQEQEKQILGYLYGTMKVAFATNELSNLFSPSSGQLNFVSVGYNIYSNAKFGKFPTELATLSATHYNYRSTYSFTGRQCYHIYMNNFIGEDEALTKSVEMRKNDDYLGVTTNFVTASTAYTFSQAGLDTLTALKKCKTFKDYQTWFDGVKPELESRLTTLLVQDLAVRKATILMLDHFQHLLTQLAINEANYLPKEEKKVRGKKKKEEEAEAEDDTSIEEVVPNETDAAAILAAITGESK